MHSIMATKISSLLLLFGVFTICNAALVDEYDHFAALDPDEKVKLYWTIDEETVSFALDGATKGWVGFGVSTGQGKMDKADMVIGWVKDGKTYLSDRHGVGHYPALDDHNDYKLISGVEDNGRTIIKFSRKIDTCDKQDQILKGGTTKLIFALNDEDPESPERIKKHTFKGIRTILFLNYKGHTKKPDASWKHFDILNRNYSVPAYHTTYHCSVHRIPEFKEKNHIIRYEPVIQSGNEGIVHHMIINVCDPNFPEHYNNVSENCKDKANMPAEVLGCRRQGLMAGGWAVGGGPFMYPSHVGFAVGNEFAGRHFVLEIHYDNPGQTTGFYDSSGMRFYYTNKLREYDAGLLSSGVAVTKWMMIPPKQQAWRTVGYCSKQCTEEALKNSPLPEGGIKIFSSNLHTHLAGRAAWTQHIRNGVELPEIDRDDNYDFNFQDTRIFEKEVDFKPGDEIIHTCIYNTMDRENLTFGGAATTDEMCLNYLNYYPFLPNMSRLCRSIDLQAGSAMLEKHYPELTSPMKVLRNPIKKSNKIWTEEMTNDYRKMIDDQAGYTATFNGCKKNNNNNNNNKNLSLAEIVKDKYQIPIPKITTPLPKPTDNCKDVDSSATTLCFLLWSHVLCLVVVTILT